MSIEELILLILSVFITMPFAILFNRHVLIPFISIFNKKMAFEMYLNIARKTSYYLYDGSMVMARTRGYPVARVQYSDGISREMAIGNAVEYASMFNGKVVPSF